jgi:glucose-6-phosphate dehydrogenase assembly protein OpcA
VAAVVTDAAPTSGTWSAPDTTPGAIERALRRLQTERFAGGHTAAAARVCNLVVIVEKEKVGEIAERLDRVGRYHPSRTIVCAVEDERTRLGASASLDGEDGGGPLRERIEIDVGPRHLRRLETVVDPVLVEGITTIVWTPESRREAIDALLGLADVVLVDSAAEPDEVEALDRVGELVGRTYVVDLAWLRSTPWRERIAAAFDPPSRRPSLFALTGVEVRHERSSGAAALLLLGWLASRLGWSANALSALDGDGRTGRAGDVELRTRVDEGMTVPGLAGVTLETEGEALALDRGPGGLRARRREADGSEREWTVLGASRGEGGILGEGVRQGLLRDPTYRPALAAARVMAA